MKNTFTLKCNNCGAETIISLNEELLHEDEESKCYKREIVQKGNVHVSVSYGYEETEIICGNCGIQIDNTLKKIFL